ncbi:Lrp/AsnC ligand binding domain-containing protein [Lactiplantibacillus plantarum]|uniref:Lrp/AsnC ligand binding domain-containing protein n=1 Tax=Lactiplantibacillus plantarum TaxID=1590 RepID=UPI0040461B8C
MDTVIVHVTLESHSEETLYEFGRALAQIPEVLEAFLVSGDYDYYIRIAVRDTRDYERLLREQLYRRIIWSRKGQFHRRGGSERGVLRIGQRRHAVPG